MIYLFYIVLLIICVIFPELTLNSAKESIELWSKTVLPSLLPFFIISKLIYYNDGITIFSKVFKPLLLFIGIPEYAAFPYVMSLLCGYPTGSRIVSQMNLDHDKNHIANISYSSSPLFIIGTVGVAFLNDIKAGYTLYIIHLCSQLIFTAICSYKQKNYKTVLNVEKGTFTDAVTGSIIAVLNICGFMILFNIIIKIATFSFFSEKTNAIISAFIEFTNGINKISKVYEAPLPFISFFLSFGGFCVIAQCLSILSGINKFKFILNRILCGLIAFNLSLLYEKTAIYVPIIITFIVIISAYMLRRKNLFIKILKILRNLIVNIFYSRFKFFKNT